ncbi:MAG TPA: nitroreductase family deazaflavin-dependent oxidoreductase [Phototrophicaceae bacterium]|nr:nitroreductase family deazaflavin-dependent oxidoreductase [Phototrophicaceae bacterium]
MAASPSHLVFPYPHGLLRFVLRAPLLFYRLGLGDLLNAAHILVLTTQGRRSGQPRHTPVEYRRHGRKISLVSAWGARTNWCQNLVGNADVTLQLGQRILGAQAQIVTDPAEALRAIHLFRRTAPGRYDTVLSYVIEETVNARTLPNLSGQFTIVRLDLTPEVPLPGLPVNLAWVWPLSLLVGVAAVGLFTFARLRKTQD